MRDSPRPPITITQAKDIRREAKFLAEWLNSGGTPQDMFRPLVKMTVNIATHLRKNQRYYRKCVLTIRPLKPTDPYLAYEADAERILRRIRKRYPSEKGSAGFGESRGRIDGSLLFAERQIRHGRAHAEVVDMLESFYFLAERGAFADFAICALPTCEKCLFALRRNRRYCSDACQRTHYDQAPERTKENAARQKKHYHAIQERHFEKLVRITRDARVRSEAEQKRQHHLNEKRKAQGDLDRLREKRR